MATFDAKLFNRIIGHTNLAGAGASLQMAYGLPLSVLALRKPHLELIPSNELSDLLSLSQGAKSRADNVIKAVMKKIMMDSGVIEYSTGHGKSIIHHKASKSAFWFNESKTIANLHGLTAALGKSSSDNRTLYSNKNAPPDLARNLATILGEVAAIKSFTTGQSSEIRNSTLPIGGSSPMSFESYIRTYYASEVNKANASQDFVERVKLVIGFMKEVINEREMDPSKEPIFNSDSYFDDTFRDTNFRRSDLPEGVGAELVADPGHPLIDLIYGPPKSKQGQFLLSEDGLYYDSQSGGLDPVLIYLREQEQKIEPGDKWKFEHDPNIGGKGTAMSYSEMLNLKSDLFNLEKIDDSKTMDDFYSSDHFLQVLTGHKNKHLYDTSAYLTELISTEGEDSAMVVNLRQSLYSDISRHDDKINRRKKQIEIAIKAPLAFSSKTKNTVNYAEEGASIPINDFSYLKDLNINISLGAQKSLVFNQSEVSGVILPLSPKYVVAPDYLEEQFNTDDLIVPEIGAGQIDYSSSSVSGTGANITSLVDQIITKDLFAIYNFLEPNVVDPGSEEYQIINCANNTIYNNAQLVGTSVSSVYVSGLAVPRLDGIVETVNTDTSTTPSAVGSYVKFQNTQEFRNLAYKKTGFTFETWVHIPDLSNSAVSWHSGGASSLTKVLLGCENIGDPSAADIGAPADFDKVSPEFGDSVVRGLLIGFSRDRRLTTDGVNFSNDPDDNSPDNTVFFIAPTQSVNDASACTFLNKENYNNNSCPSSYTFHKMVVSGTTLGSHSKKYVDVSSSYVLVNVSVDPNLDEIKMSLDGELMATSSLSEVFGTRKYAPINIPSLARSNSFEYNSSSVSGVIKLQQGPKLHKSGTLTPVGFTPWILGGGYTDGMHLSGNFMGGTSGGITSGLRGYVGSTKFYSRALTAEEILKNYTSQQALFKNIKV